MPLPSLKSKEYLQLLLDTTPVAVFVVDGELRILDANKAALDLLQSNEERTLQKLCGEALRCAHAVQAGDGCGTTSFCPDCALRQSAEEALAGGRVTRRYAAMQQEREGSWRPLHLLVSAAAIELEGRSVALLTLEDVTELYELREIIPICSSCKRIRNDAALWEQVESYLQRHAGMTFTHGICPDCKKKLYPDFV